MKTPPIKRLCNFDLLRVVHMAMVIIIHISTYYTANYQGLIISQVSAYF